MPPSLTVCNTDSLGEQIQRAFPQTKVVKTLNTMNAYLAIATVGFRVLAPRFAWSLPVDGTQAGRSFIGVLFFHVLTPLVSAFMVTGFLSFFRFATASRSHHAASGTHPQDWVSHAAWGSAGWWVLTVALAAALCVFAWRRPT